MLIFTKRLLKKNKLIEKVSRCLFLILPVHFREKVSYYSNNPYSRAENECEIIFVHIPKCAGNSMMKSLFGIKGQGHNKLKDYYYFDSDKFNRFVKFAVMRDPIDRFISAYNYLVQGGMGNYDQEFADRYINNYSINEFISKLANDKRFRKIIIEWTHFQAQSDYMCVNNEMMLDYVIDYKRLSEGTQYLASKEFGKDELIVEKTNITMSKDINLTQESLAILEVIYKEDILLYNRLFIESYVYEK